MEKTPQVTDEEIVAAHTQLERELNGGKSEEDKMFDELEKMINSGEFESVETAENILTFVELPEKQESILREKIAKIKNRAVAGAITDAHAPVTDKLKGLIVEAGRQNEQKVAVASDEAQVAEAVAVLGDEEVGVQKISPEQRKAALDQYDASRNRGTAQQYTGATPPPIPKETIAEAPKTEEEKEREEKEPEKKAEAVAEQPKTPEEKALDSAREKYVAALHEYKKNKPMVNKMLDSLDIGVLKGGRKIVEPRALVEAKKNYLEAKRKMSASVQQTAGFQTKKVGEGTGHVIEEEPSLLGQKIKGSETISPVVGISVGDKVMINGTEIEASGDFSRITFLDRATLDLAEKEVDKLQQAIEQAETPLKKNIFRKSLDVYRKVPLAARVGLTSAVLGAASGAAIGALAAGTAIKIGRAAVGATLGKATANALHHVYEKGHQKKKEEMAGNYADVYAENDTKEDDFLAALQKEIQKKKAERFVTAGAAVVVGGATTLGSSLLETPDTSNIVGYRIPTPLKSIPVTEGVTETEVPVEHLSSDSVKTNLDSLKPKAGVSGAPASAVEQATQQVAETGAPIRVELSSQGFIQTFEDMKAKLIEQYGSVEKVPASYKHFVETPSTKLAEEFGVYKPAEGTSGMGYKGEALELKEGKLIYDKIGDTDTTLFEKGTQTAKFEGTMFTPEPTTEGVEEDDNTGLDEEHGDDADEGGDTEPSPESEVDEPHKTPSVPVSDEGYTETDPVQESNMVSKPKFNPEHTRIMTFSGQNITALNEQLQNDVKFAGIRAQFAKAFDVAVKEWALPVQKTIPFEGGRVDIVQLGGKNTLLLNGEPFAEGVVGSRIKLLSDKRSFFTETVYERAFKFGEVKDAVKQLVVTPKK